MAVVSASQPEGIYSPHLLNDRRNGVLIDTLMPNNNFVSGMISPTISGSSFVPHGHTGQDIVMPMITGPSFVSQGHNSQGIAMPMNAGPSFVSQGHNGQGIVMPMVSGPSFVSQGQMSGLPMVSGPSFVSQGQMSVLPAETVGPIVNQGSFGNSLCASSNIVRGMNIGCGSSTIQRVPVQIGKQVPIKTVRYYPMVTNSVPISPESQTDVVCPIGSQLNGDMCEVISSDISCPHNFEWNGNRCIAISKSCPENYEWKDDNCVPRFLCPAQYTWKDNVCQPPQRPTPQCPYNFRWNGEICEIAQTLCKSGVLKDGKCEKENYDCPTGFNKIGIQCIKSIPICPAGYTMMQSGSCSKTTNRCPPGSYSQNNQCVSLKQECPPGTTLNGNQCSAEEISFKTEFETQYVDRPIQQQSRVGYCHTSTCAQNPCPLNTCIA
ncbi:unnamed protein product [Diamesa serratosioi]